MKENGLPFAINDDKEEKKDEEKKEDYTDLNDKFVKQKRAKTTKGATFRDRSTTVMASMKAGMLQMVTTKKLRKTESIYEVNQEKATHI